eukprot:c31497_g1_i1 orf=196-435(-)
MRAVIRGFSRTERRVLAQSKKKERGQPSHGVVQVLEAFHGRSRVVRGLQHHRRPQSQPHAPCFPPANLQLRFFFFFLAD